MATIAEQLTQLNTDLVTIKEKVNTQAELIAQIKALAEDAEIDGTSGNTAVDLATPSITVNSSGLITATVTQPAGYVVASTKSSSRRLDLAPATTATPGTTDRTIVSTGKYTTGDIVIKGDENLVAANIKTGTSIFGVTGSLIPLKPYLPLAIQGGFAKVTADSWGTGTQFYQHSHFYGQSVGGITYDIASCTATTLVAQPGDSLLFGSGPVTVKVTNNTALYLTAFVTVTSTYIPNNSPSSSYLYDYKIIGVPPMTTQEISFTPTSYSAGGTITTATSTITGVIWDA